MQAFLSLVDTVLIVDLSLGRWDSLAACLQAIARLLNIRGGRESNPQRERLELEIASNLAEANAAQEQVAFEALIHGPPATRGLDLETATAAVEEFM
jgi:hypothetical protein